MDYTELLDGFAARLRRKEKSRATAEKYLHDAAAFAANTACVEASSADTTPTSDQYAVLIFPSCSRSCLFMRLALLPSVLGSKKRRLLKLFSSRNGVGFARSRFGTILF